MAKALVTEQYLNNIADAIRTKNGSQGSYTPAQMSEAINALYPEPSGSIDITQNGIVDVKSKATANVNVPNTYDASDNGKVVVNQALASQTSKNITANGTHDTTSNNSVVVNVSNSYAAEDEGKVVFSGQLVTQTSRSVTENGTYDTTENDEVVVNVPTEGGGSSYPISPDYKGRSYAYIGLDGSFRTYTSNGNYVNFYRLNKDKTYAVFIGINVSNRLRIHFYGNKSYSDFEQYVLNAGESTRIYTCDNNITEQQELSGEDLKKRFIFTPTTNGELVIMTSNEAESVQYIAYCVEL